ncbi:MAG: hypothetical protein K2W95_12050 [Candidatus Obscuribacterales bacterium]|nr:hypothetical protein [Candidatus Obscuribacterales bacterium]
MVMTAAVTLNWLVMVTVLLTVIVPGTVTGHPKVSSRTDSLKAMGVPETPRMAIMVVMGTTVNIMAIMMA